MYTRSYFNEEESVSVPENYDGNAFRESTQSESPENSDSAECAAFKPDAPSEKSEEAGRFSSLFGRLPFGSMFKDGTLLGSLGSVFNFSSVKFGAEEILLCALAAYLFLSKDGDRECAIMLLLLVFIS